ncbi:MAG: hypothetical protein HQL84_11080 [Magnetococcales bacterium]|nr:hypothetical protein [Magnetococcales bacterium]MBF0150576.1 hypothetical protein [Magnetococcales bacterium]MBF0171827.1 hypothetical protein [Magnetococcales bacterium]MBF0346130.1 hypothetical protein [Magnetococcales bacterium]MBF0632586.1 hypothetical protein [Magnetococcales bacterium]
MENINNNNIVANRFDAVPSHAHPHQTTVCPEVSATDSKVQTRLIPLSFNTELSASDLNRLLKIVSANDLP